MSNIEYKGLSYVAASRMAQGLIDRRGWYQCFDQLVKLKCIMDRTRPGLPTYKSHKTVRAVKIAAVELRDDGSAIISPVGAECGPFQTNPGWAGRWKGVADDLGYYVQYEDGYESWSPAKAFEEGYTLV